jgi:membrane protein implicated in regulation of membrane protease activity
VLAIICFVLEIFTPGFFLMSIGIGALAGGLISFFSSSIPLQIMMSIVSAFVTFLWLRKFSSKFFDSATDKTNIYGLVGKKGVVTREISENGRGYVKIGGEEWPAVIEEEGFVKVETGAYVTVNGVEGNKLIVSLPVKGE